MIQKRRRREAWLHPLALERRIQILSSVLENEDTSPADLARDLACTRAESTRHVDKLLENRYLEKTKRAPGAIGAGRGRPGQGLRLAPRFAFALAILHPEGATWQAFGRRLENGAVETVHPWKNQGELLHRIHQMTRAKLGENYRLFFCVDGIVMKDLLATWDALPDWKPLSTSYLLDSGKWRTGGAITWAAALAQGCPIPGDVFVIHWNRGLKIAYRSRGELRLGERGTTTPIGHREVRESGRLCRCGRTNCLESLLEKPDANAMRDVAAAARGFLGKKSRETTLLWSGPWAPPPEGGFRGFASSESPDGASLTAFVQTGAKKLIAANLFRWELKRETP